MALSPAPSEYQQSIALSHAEGELRHFMHMVYGWMSLGLAVTACCALFMASDPRMILNLVGRGPLFWGLLIAEFVLVVALAGWVEKMEANTAKVAFLSYSALTGVTTSVIFLVYTRGSIASTFFVTAGMFGALCAYGYTTGADLTTVGSYCMMGLVGIILSSLANFWLHSRPLYWVTTYVGIAVFVGLTAYDAQRVKAMFRPGAEGTDEETKEAISGALALYLDFINLFLKLLSLGGKRND